MMFDATERRLVLASRSPRRLELLQQLGFEPKVVPAEIDEEHQRGETFREYTCRLSSSKAEVVASDAALWDDSSLSPWVLAADTIVIVGDKLLEKPIDRADAVKMLEELSGRWHTVMTSFTIIGTNGRGISSANIVDTSTVETEVRFKPLSLEEIELYVDSGEPMDKAGAYGIQEFGSFLVREIRGSYFAVVGLPVCEVVERLVEVGAVRRFPLC